MPFTLHDDDNDSILPRNPDTTDLARAFLPAYVVPLFDLTNLNLYAPFKANLAVDDTSTKQSMYAFDNIATEADSSFWTVYLLGAFQHVTYFYDSGTGISGGDADPNSEGATLGEVDDINGQGAMIFLEDLREIVVTPYASEAYTVSHEVGHLFNGIHQDLGLMTQTSTRTNVDFSATTLNRIRKIPHP